MKKHFTSAPGQRNGDVFARDATRKYHAVGPLHVACVDSLHLRQTRQVVKTKAHTEVQFPLLSQATSNGDCAKSRPQRVRREMTNRETPQSRRPRTTSSREDSRGFEAAPVVHGWALHTLQYGHESRPTQNFASCFQSGVDPLAGKNTMKACPQSTGRSSAWIERCVRDAEVAGSNPVAPTL